MILLERENYHKVIESIRSVAINHLFARSVIEHKITGKIFVDEPENPKTFYVLHPYGMSLLFGDCNNERFNDAFKRYALNLDNARNKDERMQVFPFEWDRVLADLFGDNLVKAGERPGKIELGSRLNFKFNKEKYSDSKKNNLFSDSSIKIVRTDKKAFEEMTGLVVPFRFWNDANDFLNNGVGFSLYIDGRLASTGFSAYIHGDKLELGIETREEFRGKGLAYITCSALIDYCRQNGLEPVWACGADNTGSRVLAQKLGFEPLGEISYYKMNR